MIKIICSVTVKPWFLVFFVLIMSLWVAACGDDEETTTDTNSADFLELREVRENEITEEVSDSEEFIPDVEEEEIEPETVEDVVEEVVDLPDPNRLVEGGVLIYEVRSSGNTVNIGNAGAAFNDPNPISPVATYGACRITTNSPESPQSGLDAGTIEISGTSAGSVTLTPSAEGEGVTYISSLSEDSAEVMAPGDRIQIIAAGGSGVAAFSGEATAPEDIQLTNDYFTFGSQVPMTSDLVINWTGSGGDIIVISVIPSDLMSGDPVIGASSITCEVPDTGQFSIPQAAMGHLPSVPLIGQSCIVSIIRANNTELTVGPAAVILSATAAFGGMTSVTP